LFTLLGELKSDIPFYSPRYVGHMTADAAMPAMVGYLATMLYNPNNVSWEASPITTLLELEVGRQLAKMFGFGRSPDELAATWGHITSGGTLANLESLWVAKAVKFLPVAVREGARALDVTGLTAGPEKKDLLRLTAWELVNLSPRQALDLKDQLVAAYAARHSDRPADQAAAEVAAELKKHEILSLGDHVFFSQLTGDDALQPAIVCAPQTMHYSWVKGPGAIGIGSKQVTPIPIDAAFRQDTGELRRVLEQALRDRRPIISVVGVVGTTEEGAADAIDQLVALRDEFTPRGLSFSLHADAAYGGYLAACFRSAGGEFRTRPEMQQAYANWPSDEVYRSYAALKDVDSITVDPHKLGFVPYPAGAVVFRDGRVMDLVAQEAAYALGGRTTRQTNEFYLGKYILEGSKPGAAVAATFLSHRVSPLDETGYGAILGQTVRTSRVWHDRFVAFAEQIGGEFILKPLTLPDTNILDYVFNLAGNDRLDVMNRFGLALYQELSIDPSVPVQTRQFMVSHTEFSYDAYSPPVVRAYLEEKMGVQGRFFVSTDELARQRAAAQTGFDDEMVVFRSTMMNLFTLQPVQEGKDYLDLFLEYLLPLLRKVRAEMTLG
jgi:glutamate/tyrosine decarboxylase-like PLP-dependent enzyme